MVASVAGAVGRLCTARTTVLWRKTFIASRNFGLSIWRISGEKRVCNTEAEMRPVTAATSKSGNVRAIQHNYCVLSVGFKTGDTDDGIFFVGKFFDN